MMSFYRELSKVYDGLFPLREHTLSFVTSLLGGKGKAVLDIGCATGELALNLAKRSHRITGIDLDPRMIRMAQDKAAERGLNCTFQDLDMMRVGETMEAASFDLITCLGNTLVHLDSLNEIKAFFKQSLSLLKDNGVLAFQVVNYDRVIRDMISSLPSLASGDVTFGRNYRFDHPGGKIIFATSLAVGKEKTLREETTLFPLVRTQAEESLTGAGFVEVRFYGTFTGEPWHANSPALIAVARKG